MWSTVNFIFNFWGTSEIFRTLVLEAKLLPVVELTKIDYKNLTYLKLVGGGRRGGGGGGGGSPPNSLSP